MLDTLTEIVSDCVDEAIQDFLKESKDETITG